MVNNRWLADRAVERNCRRKSKGEPGSMVVDLAEEQLRRWLLVANARIGTYLGIWVYVLGVLAEKQIANRVYVFSGVFRRCRSQLALNACFPHLTHLQGIISKQHKQVDPAASRQPPPLGLSSVLGYLLLLRPSFSPSLPSSSASSILFSLLALLLCRSASVHHIAASFQTPCASRRDGLITLWPCTCYRYRDSLVSPVLEVVRRQIQEQTWARVPGA